MAAKKEVPVELIEKIKKSFVSLPAKQPATKLLQDALEELKPVLEAAVEKGYSRVDVIELLGRQGLEVKPYHLKALFAAKRSAANKETK